MTDSPAPTRPPGTGRAFVANVMRLGTGNVVGQAVAIGAAPVLSRLYTPEQIGLLTLFIAACNVTSVLGAGRYDLAIHLPRSDEESWQVLQLAASISLSVTLATLGIILLFGDAIAVRLGVQGAAEWLYLVPLGVLFIAWTGIGVRWQSRNDRYSDIVRNDVSLQVATAGLQVASGAVAPSGLSLIGGRLAGQLVALTQLFRTFPSDVRRFGFRARRADLWARARRYWRFPVFSGASGILSQTTRELPALIITAFFAPDILGFYALALRVIGQPMAILGGAVGHVFFQHVSQVRDDVRAARKLILRVSGTLFLISLVPSAILLLWAVPMFTFVFGPEWGEAGVYSQLLVPRLILQFMTAPTGLSMQAFEKQHVVLVWNSLYLALGAAALYLGGIEGDPRSAIWYYALVGAFMYGVYLVLSLVYAGGDSADTDHHPSDQSTTANAT